MRCDLSICRSVAKSVSFNDNFQNFLSGVFQKKRTDRIIDAADRSIKDVCDWWLLQWYLRVPYSFHLLASIYCLQYVYFFQLHRQVVCAVWKPLLYMSLIVNLPKVIPSLGFGKQLYLIMHRLKIGQLYLTIAWRSKLKHTLLKKNCAGGKEFCASNFCGVYLKNWSDGQEITIFQIGSLLLS